MSRLPAIELANATGKAKDLLTAVKAKLGIVLNMTKVMANSPAVLEGYLGLSGALGGGLLDAKTREQLALATAQENECNYCLSAHSAIGKMVGLTPEQVVESRKGQGVDARTTAALTFAQRVLETRGGISDNDLAAVRQAGFNDGEIAEIIAHVALNILTNYFNKAAQVDIDFPKVSFAEIA
ncbi:carboxymuconolactone decarboxylase family protein [Granulicella sp. WH15]|uniref:carboxymuconolactone decarboxylase family protein n=1 Tax=Granulicella sp. WH15 TaxID=2602070 RepID=UPI0013674452|nr:carboxymuconolactone decarboxylase family protein [Granulicella sp. WH15]QHN04829.1 carboxymuconolactone decarboxylase family protein [Granulicella sp. WH15]